MIDFDFSAVVPAVSVVAEKKIIYLHNTICRDSEQDYIFSNAIR